MHSRRDQVEAYSFANNRLRSALVRGEPDAPRAPLRRTPIGLIIGAVLALLGIGGVALLALIKPGSTPRWRQSGVLIIEKQTGIRYVYDGGQLHPVFNYASARLLLPEDFDTAAVSASTLASVPRGNRIGIEGAPEILPGTAAGGRSWLVCAPPATAVDGQVTPQVTVLLDPEPPPQDAPAAVALVHGPDGTRFVVHGGVRMKVTADWVIPALGYLEEQSVPVTGSWLDVLPAGPDLGALDVAGRGVPGPDLAGTATRVGQILVATEPGLPKRYFLVTSDGLVPVNQTVVALVLGDPASREVYLDGAYPVPIDPATLATARLLTTPDWAERLPDLPRQVSARADQVPCAQLRTDGDEVHYTLVTVPAPKAQVPPVREPHTVADARTAGGFSAPAGGGALVRTLPAPGAAGIGLHLIVETGARYPLADEEAATALGFAPSGAAPIPAALLTMLPTGPELRVLGGDR
ncbi:type VII secretion protein EccB [Solwaraspora sp. WMMB335]|uniref:type VII secretion protein EccB n=1 Tax=Solwaraspora sp. WMMB335 TaxID=3404118 RepID=UPI003B939506